MENEEEDDDDDDDDEDRVVRDLEGKTVITKTCDFMKRLRSSG